MPTFSLKLILRLRIARLRIARLRIARLRIALLRVARLRIARLVDEARPRSVLLTRSDVFPKCTDWLNTEMVVVHSACPVDVTAFRTSL